MKKRFSQHCKDSKKVRNCKRPLYDAMNKYGVDKFHISLVEECSIDNINEREQYWIKQYNSYKNGYNATAGGDGKIQCDYNKVYELYQKGESLKDISSELGYDQGTCRKAIRLLTNIEHPFIKYNYRPIRQIDKNNGDVIKEFESVREAARFINGDDTFIRRVALGKRPSAYGYKWEYI